MRACVQRCYARVGVNGLGVFQSRRQRLGLREEDDQENEKRAENETAGLT